MSTPNDDTLRDLIANQPKPEISKDFVERTVAAAREIEQEPAGDIVTRVRWLKMASLAAAAALVLALSLDALKPVPEVKTETPIAIADTEDVDLAILIADAQHPEDRLNMQLMLVLDENTDISDDDLLAFAL